MAQSSKRLFIQTIPSVPLFGMASIPTALYYRPDKEPLIGFHAEDAAIDPLDVNRDFKVDLGHNKPSTANRQRFRTATGDTRSAVILTSDFLRSVLVESSQFLKQRGIDKAARVMIAEPVRMHSEENSEWLANYRSNLRNLLKGVTFEGSENISFEDVEFLPEPFAVFQYYRHGVRHEAIQQRRKYCALVVDFGGGTFDVCVIETTLEGEISYGGKSSNAYGASSVAVGGYFVNRKLVEHLMELHVVPKQNQKRFRRSMELYQQYRDNKIALEEIEENLRPVVQNFHRASFAIEKAKIKLCRSIRDWSMEADLSQVVHVQLPDDLFVENPGIVTTPLSAREFRDIFLKEIWQAKIKDTIRYALTNAVQSLKGQPINLVLLSGGSANIGWLESLIRTDFDAELAHADFLPLEDYQEVVAKGLAVECARKFYSTTSSGDFESVVYNPLWLTLDIAETGIQKRPFLPLMKELPNCSNQPGLLLDAATSLASFIDKPMMWKVKQVAKEPKRLRYYFLRSEPDGSIRELDQLPVEARVNLEETRIDAPGKCVFDSELKFRLRVRNDGTATPTFIYHTARTEAEEIAKSGVPFFLDMTAAATIRHSPTYAYVGLDFGTSNSSVSFVNHDTIREYEERSRDASWVEVTEIVGTLPHILSEPLQSYVSETNNKDRAAGFARDFIENTLWLGLISCYIDYCDQLIRAGKPISTRLFKDLHQNSAGLVWTEFKRLLNDPEFQSIQDFSKSWRQLIKEPNFNGFDETIRLIALVKHSKADAVTVDWHDAVHLLGNVAKEFSSQTYFGFFEKVETDPFTNEILADFRLANGKPPFPKCLKIKLDATVSHRQPYLINTNRRKAHSLLPFLMCRPAQHPNDYEHGLFWILDSYRKNRNECSYKSVYRIPPFDVDLNTERYNGLLPEISKHWAKDSQVATCNILEIS